MTPTYEDFCKEVEALLNYAASDKGYNRTGVDGENALYDFVNSIVGENKHALGEIIYKVRRYASKRDPKDVLKIAAWAFLIWRDHKCQENEHV